MKYNTLAPVDQRTYGSSRVATSGREGWWPSESTQALRRGFTLTELLVVIAVLTVLAILIIPVVNQTIQRSRLASCTSNLHQIWVGINLYTTENDGILPPTNINNNGNWLASGWFPNILEEQLPDPKIWNCPAQNDQRMLKANWRNDKSWYLGSYAYNSRVAGRKLYLVSEGFPYAGNQILMADGRSTFWNSASIETYLDPVHGDRVNCLFIDGHVASVPPDEIKTYYQGPNIPDTVIYANGY